jgi:hypothetical protein
MAASEIERLNLRLHEAAESIRDYAEREVPQATRVVKVEQFPGMPIPQSRM